jgi:hypothetical protein
MRDATEALERLGVHIGLGPLALDEEGVCGLVIGEDTEILLSGEADAEVLQLTGVVGDLRDDDAALAVRLLELNAGDSNVPAAFAADPLTGEILLSRQLVLNEMSLEHLLEIVEEFVERVEFWTEHLPQMALGNEDEIEQPVPDAVVFRG